MMIDVLDSKAVSIEQTDFESHLLSLHNGIETTVRPSNGYYFEIDSSADVNTARMIGIEKAAVEAMRPTIMEAVKQMLYGIDQDGFHTLGLEEISSWKINSEYQLQNIKQQSGYAAEVVSTMKENLIAKAQGSDIRTFRADDLPQYFKRNDQYVDKVRMTSDGTIVERIQTKFVGSNGEKWLEKVLSKDYDKYFNGNVDKLECPKNYYDDVIKGIQQRKESLNRQLESVTAQGKTEVVIKKQLQLDKLNKLENMVEQSTVSSDEAIFARQHPKAYAAKMFASETMKISNSEGLRSGALAAGLTFAVSTVDNVKSLLDGKINASEMALNVVEDTASAGALGYGTSFVSTAVSQSMKGASSQLLRNIGASCLPTAAVTFAVESYDDISEYVQGKIDGIKLAYNLSDNAAMIVGGIEGAKLGAALGSLGGPIGSAVGTIVGGMIGCVVTSEIYKTAVELGVQGAELIAQKATEFADKTIDAVKEAVPENLDTVKNAFNDFFSSAHIPFVNV